MESQPVPHFANDDGVKEIRIRVKHFTCIGARPPMDHPHIYLEMGAAKEIVCPYCSTRYVFTPKLEHEAEPASAVYEED